MRAESHARRSIEEQLRPQRKVLAALMRSDALTRGDVTAALEQMTEVSSEVLDVERVSVWTFDSTRGQLQCANLFERSSGAHTRGAVLVASATPRYFAALAEERSIPANDARSDPRTSEFTEGYLVPNNITSMLDAPILLRGQMVGVVCHETVGRGRRWKPWEELVAATFADFAAMVIGAHEQVEQAEELKRYRSHLERLVEERTQELKQSEESFRRLFAASPVAMVLTQPAQATIIAGNARASALFGIPVDEAPGLHSPSFWVEPAERLALIERVRAEGSVEHFEARLKTASGRVFWADIAGQALTYDRAPALLFGIRDVTEQKELAARLLEMATTDELTGAFNRRRILEIAEEEIRRSDRYGHPLSMAMIDADHFKQVNDRFGHLVGDQVLRMITATAKRELRAVDSLGRYGGEEILALLPETPATGAFAVMDRVRRAVASAELPIDGGTVTAQVSIGVVQRQPGDGLDATLRRADEALYAAKAAGRNRVSTPA